MRRPGAKVGIFLLIRSLPYAFLHSDLAPLRLSARSQPRQKALIMPGSLVVKLKAASQLRNVPLRVMLPLALSNGLSNASGAPSSIPSTIQRASIRPEYFAPALKPRTLHIQRRLKQGRESGGARRKCNFVRF